MNEHRSLAYLQVFIHSETWKCKRHMQYNITFVRGFPKFPHDAIIIFNDWCFCIYNGAKFYAKFIQYQNNLPNASSGTISKAIVRLYIHCGSLHVTFNETTPQFREFFFPIRLFVIEISFQQYVRINGMFYVNSQDPCEITSYNTSFMFEKFSVSFSFYFPFFFSCTHYPCAYLLSLFLSHFWL